MKEIKDDINRWRDIPRSWIGRIDIVKVAILKKKKKSSYPTTCSLQIQCVAYQLPMAYFTELKQKNSQFIWKHKRPQIAKVVLRKTNGAGGINLPDFRL